jgi:hypothetical protein
MKMQLVVVAFFYDQRSPVGRTGGHEAGSRYLLFECA